MICSKYLSYPTSPHATQIMNSKISANHDKIDGLSAMQWRNPYKGDCFSIVESLLTILLMQKVNLKKIFLNLNLFSKFQKMYLNRWSLCRIQRPKKTE